MFLKCTKTCFRVVALAIMIAITWGSFSDNYAIAAKPKTRYENSMDYSYFEIYLGKPENGIISVLDRIAVALERIATNQEKLLKEQTDD